MFFFRYSHDDKRQSPMLKRVNLKVSTKSFKHTKMLGTLVEKKNGVYQDPCAGDSGGPLMYQDQSSRQWILIGQSETVHCIVEKSNFQKPREDFETMSLLYHKVYAGTVHGAGLDCRTGDVHSFEGSTDGIWNKVGYLY